MSHIRAAPKKEPFELNTSLLIKLAFVESVRYDGMAFGSGCVGGYSKEVAMAGKFSYLKFKDIDLSDPFFDSLKVDYPDFDRWFESKRDEPVFVYHDDEGVGAFLYIKDKENEDIELIDGKLPLYERTKIGTLKLSERMKGQRIGEGAFGLALWRWRKLKTQEIYLTVYPKHDDVVALACKFGFTDVGARPNGEHIYLKKRFGNDYSDPYKSFPFINPKFEHAGYVIINDVFHDDLFPYSELKGNQPNREGLNEKIEIAASNGVTKYYIGSPTTEWPYKIGEPLLVYRRYTGNNGKPSFRSCITSFVVVTEIVHIKGRGKASMTEDEFIRYIKNKSVYSEEQLRNKYKSEPHLVVLGMLYTGYFGAGNNVNMRWLQDHGFWPQGYPTTARLSVEQFKSILKEGEVNVSDVIVD